MKTLKLFFILVTLLIHGKALADEEYNLHFCQISTKDGLSQNTVRAILEDKKGFIWAGTLDGLNRYDGYRIQTYKPQLGNISSLIDHRVKDVYQDKDGYLWIKTYKNEFSCYDPVTDSFIDYLPDDMNNKSISFLNYYEDPDRNIWLWGNANCCLRIKKDKNKRISSKTFLSDKIQRNKNYNFLFRDSKANIWIGGNTELYNIEGEEQVNTFFQGKYSFTKATELNNKIYFITEESYIIEYDIKRKSFKEVNTDYPKGTFINLTKTSNNELLISTKTSGIIIFNTNNYTFDKPQWAKDT